LVDFARIHDENQRHTLFGAVVMSDVPSPAIYALAAKIATSYARTNAVALDALPGVIQQAFQGLMNCTKPATPTEAPKKGRRSSTPANPTRHRKG
jgi:predicted transcriptional regulator